MKNKDYWIKREKERLGLTDSLINDQVDNIKYLMDKAINKLENDIYKLYEKYGKDNKLSYQETLMYLADDERKEFQKGLKEYIETFKDKNKAEIYREELQAISTRARVKRLQVLQTNIRIQATELEKMLKGEIPSVYDSVYKDSYFYNLFSINDYTNNLGARFDIPSPRITEELLTRPWSGKNYSQKVWNVTNNFTNKVDEVVTVGLIRGEHPNKIASNLKDSMIGKNGNGGKLYEYERLVRTEAAFIAEQATIKSYEDCKLEKYEYLATLDLRTSDICQSLDEKKFNVKDAVTGVNYPPMHPCCRSTTVPVIEWDDEEPEPTERIARDPITNKSTSVYDMDYSEWKEDQYRKYGKDNITAEEKKIRNKASDKMQHKKYRDVLGNDIPSKFDDFQQMKYNNSNQWNKLKESYRVSKEKDLAIFDNDLPIPDDRKKHIWEGEGKFANPSRPENGGGALQGGGHGQGALDLMEQRYKLVEDRYNNGECSAKKFKRAKETLGYEYKEYDNGVRIGNVFGAKNDLKNNKWGQTWFPKQWTEEDIWEAGQYITKLSDKKLFNINISRDKNGNIIKIDKYAKYKGVSIGIMINYANGNPYIGTIFPDTEFRFTPNVNSTNTIYKKGERL